MPTPDYTTQLGSDAFGLGFSVFGLRDLEKALKAFSPEIARRLNREIKGALDPIVRGARGDVPTVALSGWDDEGSGEWSTRLGWDPSAVAKGIKVRKGGASSSRARAAGDRTAYRIVNQSAAGAVFELAGRRSSSPFTRAVGRQHGRASRLIWRAWDRHGGKQDITDKITTAIEDAERDLQQMVDAGAGV